MKQKQYSPLSVAEMALSLFAVNEGFLDDPVPANKVVNYEEALHDFARANHSDILESDQRRAATTTMTLLQI